MRSRLCSKQRAICVAAQCCGTVASSCSSLPWHRCQAGKLFGKLPLHSLPIQPTLPPTHVPPSHTLQLPWRGCRAASWPAQRPHPGQPQPAVCRRAAGGQVGGLGGAVDGWLGGLVASKVRPAFAQMRIGSSPCSLHAMMQA